MKKLSSNELNVLSNEISKRVNEKKYESIKGKLEKDVDFKKLEKLNKEVNDLNKKLNEKRSLNNELVLKIRSKYDIMNVNIDNNNEVKVMFNNSNYSNYYNDIILYNIGKELNVDELINKLVDKYVNK
jgi:vacuolar-type H+-ATPase subunit I/STV1